MRWVLWLVTVIAALYGGYWFVGSRALMQGAGAALSEMQAAGRADYATFEVTGFPSRFDMTVTEPELVSADGTLRWSAPDLHIYALSYKPHHIIAVLPTAMTVTLGPETLSVTSDDLRASAVFGIDPALPLLRAQSIGTSPALSSDRGWGASAREVRVALRQGADATEQEFGLEVLMPRLSGLPATLVARDGSLPVEGERIRFDAVLRLDRPLDRFAAEQPVHVTAADLHAINLDWGPVRLSGAGSIEISASGYPEGRFDLDVRNWRPALGLATGLGLIRAEVAPTVKRALEQLALAGGDAETLSLPLVFAGGRMSLGPVPLGPAPRF